MSNNGQSRSFLPRRVLFVLERYAFGGLETHLDTLVEQLVRRDVGVYCISGPDFASSRVRSMVRRYATVDMQAFTGDSVRSAAEEIANMIARESVDVVHLHPYLSLLPGAVGSVLAGVPYVATFHGIADLKSLAEYFGGFFIQSTARFVLPTASAVTCVSEQSAKAVNELYGYSRDQIRVSRNPIDLSRFRSSPLPGRSPKSALVVSRLDGDKYESVRASLQLVRELRRIDADWQVLVAGSGTRAEELRSYACGLGLADAQFLGFRADVPDLIQQAHLVVGMGRVVLEAIASGRPAVLAGHNGLVGLVDPTNFDDLRTQNFNGASIPAAAPEAVALRVAYAEEHERAQLRSRVAQDFGADTVGDQWLNWYGAAATAARPETNRETARRITAWLAHVGRRSFRTLDWAVDQHRWPVELLGPAYASAFLTQALHYTNQRFQEEQMRSQMLQERLAAYRAQRAWKIMLWIRKAYTVATQGSVATRIFRLMRFGFKTLFGRVNLDKVDLTFRP